jgi:site-specific DNA-cytosine methylase
MAAFTGWAPQQKGIVLDGFAGPGGWSEGIRRWLGLHDVGLEWDESAVKTRAAAGHVSVRVDVSCFVLGPLIGRVWGLLMSPPCTKFSTAGNGLGRKFIAVLSDGIRRMMRGEDCRQEMRDLIYPAALAARRETNAARAEGKRWSEARVEAAALEDTVATVLVLEPARFLYALICGRGEGQGMALEWAAFEQVPSVLPLWEVYADELRRLGWSVWTGVLNAANYRVPQTRERAVLIASSVRKVVPPAPTHTKVSEPDPLLNHPGPPRAGPSRALPSQVPVPGRCTTSHPFCGRMADRSSVMPVSRFPDDLVTAGLLLALLVVLIVAGVGTWWALRKENQEPTSYTRLGVPVDLPGEGPSPEQWAAHVDRGAGGVRQRGPGRGGAGGDRCGGGCPGLRPVPCGPGPDQRPVPPVKRPRRGVCPFPDCWR